jgi:hypothetical protein
MPVQQLLPRRALGRRAGWFGKTLANYQGRHGILLIVGSRLQLSRIARRYSSHGEISVISIKFHQSIDKRNRFQKLIMLPLSGVYLLKNSANPHIVHKKC